ncbi:MAG: hypothetical protein Q8S43_07415 [Actinomycetota bacterium]|nr:MAG: hypothetical protein FD171_355 [Actinomycetota bacterium]MDO8950270.1 hypothetical protein [Actinomycetota bacterium]MDP3630762.1 hypothetical protein [Actinomycetota bacterium]
MLRWRRGSVALVALALITTFALPLPAVAVRTLGLSTGKFEFTVAAGQKGSGEVVVMNSGDEPLQVLIYAANQKIDAKGQAEYVVPSPEDTNAITNAASWLRLTIDAEQKALGNTPYIDLKPGQRVPVHFEFEVPDGVPPGDHQIMLFFQMMAGEAPKDSSGTAVSGRLGSRIRVRVKGDIVERLEVRPFAVRNFIIGDTIPYTLLIRNDGNIDKTVNGRVMLLDGSENELESSAVATETTIFAGSNVELSGSLGKGRIGRYTARFEMKYPKEGSDSGVAERIVKDRTVIIIPMWLAVGLILVVGGAALWASWRMSVKAAERRIRRERAAKRPTAMNRRATDESYYNPDDEDRPASLPE